MKNIKTFSFSVSGYSDITGHTNDIAQCIFYNNVDHWQQNFTKSAKLVTVTHPKEVLATLELRRIYLDGSLVNSSHFIISPADQN